MKVLFLDVDGVLNSINSKGIMSDIFPIDPEMAARVARIVAHTECEVVLSSSWRYSEEGVQQVRDKVCPVLDITPKEGHQWRNNEIAAWLNEHPEVTRYAILDDDINAGIDHAHSFFLTFWHRGLTDETADAVIAHLNQP